MPSGGEHRHLQDDGECGEALYERLQWRGCTLKPASRKKGRVGRAVVCSNYMRGRSWPMQQAEAIHTLAAIHVKPSHYPTDKGNVWGASIAPQGHLAPHGLIHSLQYTNQDRDEHVPQLRWRLQGVGGCREWSLSKEQHVWTIRRVETLRMATFWRMSTTC